MEIIRNIIQENSNFPLDFKENMAFFDIETTGLSRKYNSIYLLGFMYKEKDQFILEQVFIDDLNKEKDLVKYGLTRLNSFDFIYNYNGDSFDIPFITEKANRFKIKNQVTFKSFDIYREISKNKNFLNFDNYKLKTIEHKLGIIRDDQYSGKDCIDFFMEYSISKDPILKKLILLHNYDDIFYMPYILETFSLIDQNRTLAYSNFSLIINQLSHKNKSFSITGNITGDLDYGIRYEEFNYSFYITSSEGFKIDLPIYTGSLDGENTCVFVDMNDIGLTYLSGQYSSLIPDNYFILKVDKLFLLDNIKVLIKALLDHILK